MYNNVGMFYYNGRCGAPDDAGGPARFGYTEDYPVGSNSKI